jgi:hypothetical protein
MPKEKGGGPAVVDGGGCGGGSARRSSPRVPVPYSAGSGFRANSRDFVDRGLQRCKGEKTDLVNGDEITSIFACIHEALNVDKKIN